MFDLLDGPIEISTGTENENFILSGYYLLAWWYKFILIYL